MVRFWKKSLFVVAAITVLAGCWKASASKESKRPSGKGISCVFLKTSELMTKPNWRSTPLGVQKAREKIGRYDAFWCAQLIPHYNRPVWQFLRRNRPDQIMLFYLSSSSTKGTAKTGVQIHLDYDFINNNHREWFLLKDARNVTPQDYKDEDKRIRWASSDRSASDYTRFYVDVPNKDFQQWAASKVLDIVSGKKQGLTYAYDGLAMDNVYVGARLHERFRYKYPRWKYANDLKSWQKGFGDYLKTIKKVLNRHGYILVVNHNPVGRDRSKSQEVWDILYESVDGILTEQALRRGWDASSYFAGDRWLAAMSRHEEVLEKGLINWWSCRPPETGGRAYDLFSYTYCSWLLIKRSGKSFYSAMPAVGSQDVLWYDEYDLLIGAPSSSRYLQNGCWLRDYSNAKVVVNPTRRVRRVVIDSGKPWVDFQSKKTVSELAMPPQSGRILLPTTYNVEEPIE